jgi:hypothetical protein
MAKRNTGKRRGRAQWAEVIQRWSRSGLSRGEFAERSGEDPAALSWWRWRLGAEEPPVRSPVLARVVVAEPVHASPETGAYWELRTSRGQTLRVAGGISQSDLRLVLAALLGRGKR